MSLPKSETATILYCHCAYARIVPSEVKIQVLEGLTEKNVAFEAVPDLCELSARHDPHLETLSRSADLRIAACYPRAVRWLFHSAQAPLQGIHRIANMRRATAEEILEALIREPDSSTDTNEMPDKG